VQKVDPDGRYDAVLNLQGDAPTVDPPGRPRAPGRRWPMPRSTSAPFVTLIRSAEERDNPNMVKAAVAFLPRFQWACPPKRAGEGWGARL